jgi:ATP-independent RNA helicase DbpA
MDVEVGALSLSPAALSVLKEVGFDTLTAIQAASIPALLAGKDLVGQSRTGSGKTAAFALPLLEKVAVERRVVAALVLCPTRELSAQVAREMRKLGRWRAGLRVLVLAGGEPLRGQVLALEKGAHIAVGTPGRVLDHVKRGTLELGHLASVVLDEADRMLDMGFEDEMAAILDALPRSRQTVFFSATFPRSIEAMSRKYQSDPLRVTIEAEPEQATDIRQLLLIVEPDQKPKALRWALQQHAHESALVFANQKATVAELENALSRAGVSVACLHGDLEQHERDRVLAKFRNASTRVLIATDVAARGIDVENLDLVINYDLPLQPDVYVHRIGRTGRAGKTGLAISFASPREQPKIQAIQQRTGVALERVKLDALEPSELGPVEALERDAAMDTLKIEAGRKQKMRPADILGALTGEAAGLHGTDIGKIEIHDNFSYVAVARSVSRAAHKSLSTGRIKGKRFLVSLLK